MFLNRTICLFMIYSCLGWIYESLYCTIKTGKWENRGFLFGPACPIYGVGAVTISFFVKMYGAGHPDPPAPWLVFIVSVLGSAVLEYVTSYVLELLFHAVWWDYSHLPLNLNGRISLFSSLGFGAGGLIIVYGIAPAVTQAVSGVPAEGFHIGALLAVAVFSADLTLTVSALTRFAKIVTHAEESFNEHMESIVETTQDRVADTKKSIAARARAVEHFTSSMTESGKAAIRRVRKFRFARVSGEHVNDFLRVIRRRSRTDEE